MELNVVKNKVVAHSPPNLDIDAPDLLLKPDPQTLADHGIVCLFPTPSWSGEGNKELPVVMAMSEAE